MNDGNGTRGLWEATAPPFERGSILSENIAVDVAIVGGGYTGCSAALHLAQQGAKVAVLEHMDIGHGGSGRNVGLVNAGMWVRPHAVKEALGEAKGSALLTFLGQGPSVVFDLVRRFDIACEAVEQGTLHCAVGAAGMREIAERARQWQALGAPVELIDARRTAKLLGTQAYRGSLLDRRAGTIQPLAYARGLARAAADAGAQIFTQTRIVNTARMADAWRLTTADGLEVRANSVIVATGAYGAHLDAADTVAGELVRLPYFNMATQPLTAAQRAAILPGRQGAWDTRNVLSSFRLDEQGRLVFGSVGALRSAGTRIHHDWGRRALAKLFPQLAPVSFDYQWYGWIGMTSNALPRFYRLGPNMVSISGYNGRGIAPGTLFGKALAALTLGQCSDDEMPLPISEVRRAGGRRMRSAGYEAGASLSHFFGSRF